MPNRYFADISHWVEEFDAAKYASAGHLLLGTMATQGQGYVDPTFAHRADAAHQHGLPVLYYHYCQPDVGAQAQLEMAHFWRTVRPHFALFDLLGLDLEREHPEGQQALVHYVAACDSALHGHSGQQPLLYTYLSMFQSLPASLNVSSRRVIIAAYQAGVPRLGHGRHRFAQQYTDGVHGPEPRSFAGIGACDGNLLTRGAYRQLRRAATRRRKVRVKL